MATPTPPPKDQPPAPGYRVPMLQPADVRQQHEPSERWKRFWSTVAALITVVQVVGSCSFPIYLDTVEQNCSLNAYLRFCGPDAMLIAFALFALNSILTIIMAITAIMSTKTLAIGVRFLILWATVLILCLSCITLM